MRWSDVQPKEDQRFPVRAQDLFKDDSNDPLKLASSNLNIITNA